MSETDDERTDLYFLGEPLRKRKLRCYDPTKMVAIDRGRWKRVVALARASFDECPECIESTADAIEPGDLDPLP